MKIKKLFLLLLASMFIFAGPVMGQGVSFPDIATITPENLFTATIEPIYGMLVILFGYLSGLIPGVKKLTPFTRVFAFALVAGLGFSLFGISAWKLASTYFLSSGLYLIILKNIFASPKADPG